MERRDAFEEDVGPTMTAFVESSNLRLLPIRVTVFTVSRCQSCNLVIVLSVCVQNVSVRTYVHELFAESVPEQLFHFVVTTSRELVSLRHRLLSAPTIADRSVPLFYWTAGNVNVCIDLSLVEGHTLCAEAQLTIPHYTLCASCAPRSPAIAA